MKSTNKLGLLLVTGLLAVAAFGCSPAAPGPSATPGGATGAPATGTPAAPATP